MTCILSFCIVTVIIMDKQSVLRSEMEKRQLIQQKKVNYFYKKSKINKTNNAIIETNQTGKQWLR